MNRQSSTLNRHWTGALLLLAAISAAAQPARSRDEWVALAKGGFVLPP